MNTENTQAQANTEVKPEEVKKTPMTDEQIQKLAIGIATDYVKTKGINSGLTQKQHTGILVTAIEEVTGVELTMEQKVELFQVMYHLANGSALRQKLEKSKVLAPSTTSTGAIDPTSFL